MTASSRIFVTHSAHDQTLAEGLVDCLRRGLGLRNDAIFCSSVDRHGIPTGEDFVTYIREKLDGTGIVIPLVTPAYLDSLFCMWELGAAWIQGTPVHPLLIHPVVPDDLPLLLKGRQAKPLQDGLGELAKVVSTLLGTRMDKPRWKAQREAFLDSLPTKIAKSEEKWPTTPRAIERRRARVGEVADRIHLVHHTLRDVTHSLMQGDSPHEVMRQELFWDSLRKMLDEMAAVFSNTTGTTCRVVMKQYKPGFIDVEVGSETEGSQASVCDFVRSTNANAGTSRLDRISENSDFLQIYNGETRIYICNDIPAEIAAGTYENSHIVAGKILPYSSTVVWPIRKEKLGRPGEWKHDLVGFLCVDAAEAGAFNETDKEIGASFADSLYVLRPCLL